MMWQGINKAALEHVRAPEKAVETFMDENTVRETGAMVHNIGLNGTRPAKSIKKHPLIQEPVLAQNLEQEAATAAALQVRGGVAMCAVQDSSDHMTWEDCWYLH